ncbi:MAG: 4-hydroxythreonine-4-phosphate dehydrogenase PdxA [Caulobacterales bacterium]|nr:4-hydroxythreonine-4-phosphate dehydrogenase PdxA [Caulobacterales bacterium]
MSAPPIAVTLGDPAGIGPEIAYAAWERLRRTGPAFGVVGDPDAITAAWPDRAEAPALARAGPGDVASLFPDVLPFFGVGDRLAVPPQPGAPNAANAPAVIDWITQAVALARSGAASAVVTCPIAKSVLYGAGFTFPGHTEYLADLTAADPAPEPRGPVMMLVGGGLRVALATVHEPLAKAPGLLTVERIARVAQVTARALRDDFDVAEPRIALCGLNPHAGEDGALGREEITVINPAAARARALGVDISDALPADALFSEEARRGYDAAIAMYHDQGLIPVKTLDFHGGVNVTLGLPIVRASPDHGTAFALAGSGQARPDSVIAAIRLAAEMAARRRAAAAR